MKSIKGKKVSVIIPAFNEAEHIEDNLNEVIRTFDDFKCDYEIILVDDGSHDRTYAVAREVVKKNGSKRVFIKKNYDNYGKGRALKKGVRYANGEYIIFLDADMDLHPAQLDTFFDIMQLTGADVVIGSKQHPNSQLNYPWHRKIISNGYYFFIKLMFGLPLHDTQTGIKLFKVEVLKKVMPQIVIKQFAFDLEILANAHRNGYQIEEAPIILDSQRTFGRIGLWAVWKTGLDTLAIFYRMFIIKYYDRFKDNDGRNFKPRRNGLRKKQNMGKRLVERYKMLM